MKRFFLLLLTILSLNLNAQVIENFTDGDFTNNPTWSGDDSVFVITAISGNNRLRSNKLLPNSSFYLSTPSTFVNNCEWEFFANIQFNPSGANYVDVYLTADTPNLLTSNFNGYFVRIGSTQDDICLYKKVTGTNTKIIDGIDGILNTTNSQMKIKVTRTTANDWTLNRDLTGTGSTYFNEGSVNDASILTSTHFGIAITQSTATFFQKHFFDDITINDIIIDVTPPNALNASVISANSIEISFDENIAAASAQNITNYTVNNGVGNPSNATWSAAIPNKVTLTFATNFTSALQLTVSVINIEDISGNAITTAQNLNFTYFAPFVAQKGDIVINEIMSDPSPVVGLPEKEFIELYNTTNNVINLQGFKYHDPSSTATLGIYNFQPKSYLILCPNADTAIFRAYGNVLGISPWPSLNNSSDIITLKNQNNELLDEVAYQLSWFNNTNKADGGWTLERINPITICGGSNNWNASIDADGGTPGRENSIFDTIPDTTPPLITSVVINSANSLLITFNESMDTASFQNGNYTFNNGLVFQNIIQGANSNFLIVNTTAPIDTGTIYTITITNIADCSGNMITSSTVEFGIGKSPLKGDLIINELLADETPPVGLPEKEFLEIYNRSNNLIDLKNCKLSDLSTTATLSSMILKPNEYVILTSTTNVAVYATFGKTLGVTSFPSLNNTTDKFTLTNPNNILIDEVEYFDTWYRDNDKKQGGWTLERINPETDCSGENNWIASVNSNGGTPGIINSVYSTAPDTIAPKLVSAVINSANSVLLTFSEVMDTASFRTANYTFTSGISFVSIAQQANFSQILVNTSTIDTGVVYIVTVTNVKDCPQNVIGSVNYAEFGIGKIPVKGDLIINELLADETPPVGLPEKEFLEIYNRSNNLIDLKDCKLSDLSSTATLTSMILKPNEYVILTSTTNVAAYASFGKTLGVTSFPSLNNTTDKFTLANPNNIIIDEVEYFDTWYRDNDKKQGGWTLERINPETDCSGENNWIASDDANGGTPGVINSVYSTVPDTIAPKLVSAVINSANSVLLTFNEVMDTASFRTANYTFSGGISFVSIAQQTNFSQILINTSTIDTGVVYMVTVANVKDCPQNIIGSVNYAEFGIGKTPSLFDIVITEIMAAETPSQGLPESEYLEIYNKSYVLISLQNCKLSDLISITTLPNAIIKPGEYVILTKTTTFSQYENLGRALGVTSWPSLNNTGDKISIWNSKGQLVHSVNYSDSWYGNSNKKGGGWSLEMVDYNNPCSGADNWKASESSIGGTPGKINSIFGNNPDLVAPILIKADAANDTVVVLTFNELIDSLSTVNASYVFDNQLTVKKTIYNSSNPYNLNIITTNKIAPKVVYSITVSGITDCIGNSSVATTYTFLLPEQGDSLDIIINEVLFNPRVGGSDFVEIYNRSDKNISLTGWKLANLSNDTISTEKILFTDIYNLKPNSYLVFTKDTFNIKNNYPRGATKNYIQLSSLPSYNDKDGIVILKNNLNKVVDRFDYNEKMHFPLIDDKNGVSLERIDINSPSNNASNWHSASSTEDYATPGYKNSQVGSATTNNVITIEPRTFSPDDDGIFDYTFINYKMDKTGYVGTITIFDANGRLVRSLVNGELLSIEGFYQWDGINDKGYKANVGLYIVVLEVFDLDGNLRRYRETVAIGAKF